MSFLRRLMIIVSVVWNLVFWLIAAVVIGDSRVLGNAALVHEDDATMLFFGAIGGVILTLLLAILLITGRRKKVAANIG